MPRGNPENMRPPQTKDEAKKRGKNGGVASGAARRKLRDEKDQLKALMNLVPDLQKQKPQTIAALSTMGIDVKGDEINNDTLLTAILYSQALKGDMKAIEYIDKRLGRNPDLALREREVTAREAEAMPEGAPTIIISGRPNEPDKHTDDGLDDTEA